MTYSQELLNEVFKTSKREQMQSLKISRQYIIGIICKLDECFQFLSIHLFDTTCISSRFFQSVLYCLSQENSRPWTKYVRRLELINTFFHLSGELRRELLDLKQFFTGFRGILRDLTAALKSK